MSKGVKKLKNMAELEAEVLINGLIIEDIPIELRTEQICINALKWGLKTYNTKFLEKT